MKKISLILFAVSSVGHASILPSSFMVEMMCKKHQGIKNVSVVQTVNFPDAGVSLTETLSVDYQTGNWESRLKDESGNEVSSKKAAFTGPKASTVALTTLILFQTQCPELIRELKQAGLPVRLEDEKEITSFDRFEGRVAWVIGKNKEQMADAQLWIEKDTFLPLRFLKKTELRFGAHRFQDGFQYPSEMSYWNSDKKLIQIDLKEIRVNSPKLRVDSSSSKGGAASSLSSEIKQSVDTFYSLIR